MADRSGDHRLATTQRALIDGQLSEAGQALSAKEVGAMSTHVLSRFLEQVEWSDAVDVYLSGLVGEDDMNLIADALPRTRSRGH